jgi:hypothetical protein
MDKPEPDYPAAHSMDTAWYAVDSDGHVALFDTGEAGAVPEEALTENVTDRDELAKVVPEAPYRLLDWLGDSTQEHHIEIPPSRTAQGLGPTLIFLRSIEPVGFEVKKFLLEQAPATEGVAVLFSDLPAPTAWRLHEAGDCLGCFAWPGKGDPWDLHDDLVKRLGLYRYRHDPKAENWISGSYLREDSPDRPLRIGQLPTEVREAIEKVRFSDLRFSETETIQPIHAFPCSSWESAYLDPDGVTVRPIPGREEDFNPQDWADDPRFRVEPPGGTRPPADPGSSPS